MATARTGANMSQQSLFSNALLSDDGTCPPGLYSTNGADPASRFAVYRNNVQSSLINALLDSYPVVAQLVGDAFFQAMARLYVQAFPPTSPVLNEYGEDFAGFIQGFAPAASLPYLADMARLERLRTRAYHAADAPAIAPSRLAALLRTPDALGRLCLGLHPSLHTLYAPYAVATLWAAHQGDRQWQGLDPYHEQHALVLRSGLDVQVFVTGAGSNRFIDCLQNGWPLEIAAAYALDADPDFDLSQCLALLISQGAITQLSPHEKA